MKLNLFDKIISQISPTAGIKRAYAKMTLETLTRGASYYDAADIGRTKNGWTTTNATANVIDGASRDIIRARARDLERNDDMYKSIILDLERNVVGTGIVMQAKYNKSNEDEQENSLNNAVETLWNNWAKPKECSVTGQFSLYEILKIIVRRRYVDGGILVLPIIKNKKFKLQLLEVDMLDDNIRYFNGHRVVGGIEIDDYNTPLAYHIKKYKDDYYTGESQRVDADNIIYLPSLIRISQVREVSPSASSLRRIDDLKQLIDAALIKEQVQACVGIALTQNSSSGLPIGRCYGTESSESPTEIDMEPGMVFRLKPGEKIEAFNPSGNSSTADNIMRVIQRQAGAGAGLSYEAVSRDMSQVNYSSARQGMLQDRKTYQDLQKYLIEHFLEPLYKKWLQFQVLIGNIIIPDFDVKSDFYYTSIKWITPGWEWIDPLKSVNANKIGIESGQTTLQEVCAERGKDYRDILEQTVKEKALLQELLRKYKIQEEGDIHAN